MNFLLGSIDEVNSKIHAVTAIKNKQQCRGFILNPKYYLYRITPQHQQYEFGTVTPSMFGTSIHIGNSYYIYRGILLNVLKILSSKANVTNTDLVRSFPDIATILNALLTDNNVIYDGKYVRKTINQKNLKQLIHKIESQKTYLTNVKQPKLSPDSVAGYCIYATKSVTIEPTYWLNSYYNYNIEDLQLDTYPNNSLKASPLIQPINVPTGVSAYFPNHEILEFKNVSSKLLSHGITLLGNSKIFSSIHCKHTAEISLPFVNLGVDSYTINKGALIAQCFFIPCLYA